MIADVPYEWPEWLTRLFSRKAPVQEPKPVETPLIWAPRTDLERAVVAAMVLAGRPVTNAELARLMNVSPAESSRRVTELQGLLHEGILRRERVGREVRISLPHLLH